MNQKKKPNILMIVADDQRFDTIHALGNQEIETPVLDSLCTEGTAFLNTYFSGSLTPAMCVPGRACIHTGAHTLNATQGKQLNRWPDLMTMNKNRSTLPNTLRQAGYHTFATGKWHNDRKSFIEGFCDGDKIFFGGMSDHTKVPVYDFDPTGEYKKENGYLSTQFSTDLFTDAAVDFIEKHDVNKPFFLYLAYTSPHDPRTAPKEFADRYSAENISLPKNFMEEHPFDNGEMSVRDELLESTPRQPDSIRQHIADYYAMISHMDHRVGDVLAALRNQGQLDDTIIVYTADHGIALGQHGLMGKQNLYDHSIRIPFILKGPGVPQAKQCSELTCQYDIFPTLCDLAGVLIPQTVDGKSLLPLLQGDQSQVHESVFAVYKDLQRMVCDGKWKLIRYYRPEEHNYGTDRIQLFNLEEDPWELNDLSEDEQCADRLKKLKDELQVWQVRMEDPWAYRPVTPPPQIKGVWGNWNV